MSRLAMITRRSSLALLFACACAALLALLAGAPLRAEAAPGAATNPAIYPAQSLPIRFDHERHQKLRLSCVYCHDGAVSSRTASDRLLPPATRCDACHGTDHENLDAVRAGVARAKECSYCHAKSSADEDVPAATNAEGHVARVVVPTPNLRMNHAVHAARGIACATCHAGVERQALATRANLPDMRTCTKCHGPGAPEGLGARDACELCHLTAESRRLRTEFPGGKLLPPSWMRGAEHGPDWLERHKLVAGSDSEFCAACHSERECVDCHDGRVRPRRIHPNDWLTLHSVSARQDGPSCTSCHRAQSFCIGCHQRSGVTASGPYGNLSGQTRFHPPRAVWTDSPRTAGHHSWEAERNMTACASCHTERDCALCHATAGRGGRGGLDPHPPGFSADCRSAFSRNPRPCLYCHEPSDRSVSQCR